MPQTPPPAMDEALGQADQVPNVKTTPKEGLLHALFAIHQGGPVDKAIGEAHARRQAEAQLHQRNMNTIAAKLHYDEKMSKDPSSMTTVMEGGVTPGSGYTPLTEDEKTKLRHQYDISEQLFNKAAGVDKPTKAHAGAISTILRHIVHRGAGQPKQQGGPTPPPADDTQGGGTPQQGIPLDSSKPTPPPSGPSDMAMLPFERADIIRQQDLQDYANKEKVLYDLKTKEDAAKAKAQAEAKKATTGSARPAVIAGISARKAKFLAASGKKYKDLDDNEINVAELPDSMGLKSFTVKMPDGHWEMRYEPFSPNQKQLTAGNQTWTINPMDVEGLATDEGTFLGEHNVPTTSVVHDPALGQDTVTQRTPTMPGIPGRSGATTPQGTAPAATPAAPAARKPSPPPIGASGAVKAAGGAPAAKSAYQPPPLDSEGHIVAGWKGKLPSGIEASPQVIAGANELMDGMALKDISGTTKTKGLSDELARSTGWYQGMFNPLQRRQVAIASDFINEMIASPALKALDKGFIRQLPMLGASGDPKTMTQKVLSKLSALGETNEQKEFLRLYRRLAGQIGSLGQISRGTNRVTEAQVNRLLSELPNPSNTADSKDAIARLHKLQEEIRDAMQKGSFEDIAAGKARGGPTPPPAAGGTPRVLVEGKDF